MEYLEWQIFSYNEHPCAKMIKDVRHEFDIYVACMNINLSLMNHHYHIKMNRSESSFQFFCHNFDIRRKQVHPHIILMVYNFRRPLVLNVKTDYYSFFECGGLRWFSWTIPINNMSRLHYQHPTPIPPKETLFSFIKRKILNIINWILNI